MCEFCVQHGEGKKWYLTMENYSRDLLDQDDRRAYMAKFLNTFPDRNDGEIRQLSTLPSVLRNAIRPFLIRNQKKNHYGQVVPLEDVEQIIQQIGGAVRLPCVCRRVTAGNYNARFCYGLVVDERLFAELDDSFSLEVLSADETIDSVRKLDKNGLVHSVWTFKTPYIGGLCNCDQDCMAFRITHVHRHYPVMFRAEWVAEVDLEACNGCKSCIRQCQFGAMRFSAVDEKVSIDPRQCYGCGVCRSACQRNAISLHAREEDPITADIW